MYKMLCGDIRSSIISWIKPGFAVFFLRPGHSFLTGFAGAVPLSYCQGALAVVCCGYIDSFSLLSERELPWVHPKKLPISLVTCNCRLHRQVLTRYLPKSGLMSTAACPLP